MSWKMRCPVCGKKLEFEETGRHYHVDCLEKNSGCAGCYYRDEEDDSGCDGHDDGYCSAEGFLYCTEELCEDGIVCSSFYFHPVWHKVIHCPHCGSFDVDECDEKNIWKLHCNSCNKTFNLKAANSNQTAVKSNKSVKNKFIEKIELEERRVKLLKDYKELYDNGVIDEDEYQQKRDELLSSMDLK